MRRNPGKKGPGKGYSLFVYGTLKNPYNLSLVLGREADIVPATLPAYEKVVSNLSYPYVVPKAGARVVGGLVSGLNDEELARADRYEDEGCLYLRRPVSVVVDGEPQDAFTYVAGPALLAGTSPDEITISSVEDRVSGFLRGIVEETLGREEAASDLVSGLTIRAKHELLGGAVEELVQELHDQPATPRFVVKQALEDGIPSVRWLRSKPQAVKYADNYVRLIVKTVVHNQTEEWVRRDFPGFVHVDDKYYERTLSSLITLSYLADNLGTLKQMAESLGIYAYDPELEYVDYVVGAIFLAEGLYDKSVLQPYIESIKGNRDPGAVPLGGEVEMSNVGHRAVNAREGDDREFDCFYYFDDFDLGNRLWKFGAHVDNHKYVTAGRGRVRGFLEFAFGRFKVLGDLSKPVTKSPWVLSELANAAVAFAEIKPHSFHVSLQLMGTRPFKPVEGPEPLICLLLLGGDINPDEAGRWREKRFFQREIYSEYQGFSFSRVNEHKSRPDDPNPARVVEFTFPRLFHEHSYVDLIMALKGYQLSYNPAPLVPYEGCEFLEHNREIEEALFDWAAEPTAPSDAAVGDFLAKVEQGLDYETRVFAGHDAKYTAYWLSEIEKKLRGYTEFIRSGGKEWLRGV